ncbi:hypothetical protein BY996DRAFT_6536896, partial [Phakopsora pachyrhizi]
TTFEDLSDQSLITLQLVWLIIEDGEKLSESIRSVLENENGLIPYVYYIYGPTIVTEMLNRAQLMP